MHSRYEIALEQYILSVGVEARLTLEMANTVILPAAIAIPDRAGGQPRPASRRSAMEGDTTHPRRGVGAINALRAGITDAALGDRPRPRAVRGGAAWHVQKGLLPAMDAVRAAADELEGLIADDLWPLATYQEMLYIL